MAKIERHLAAKFKADPELQNPAAECWCYSGPAATRDGSEGGVRGVFRAVGSRESVPAHVSPEGYESARVKEGLFAQGRTEFVTIDRTDTGKWLKDQCDKLKVSPTEERKLWDTASRSFAENCHGHVKCFIADAVPRSSFFAQELPALLKNEKVATVNGIDRLELLSALQHKTAQMDAGYASREVFDLIRSQSPGNAIYQPIDSRLLERADQARAINQDMTPFEMASLPRTQTLHRKPSLEKRVEVPDSSSMER